MGVGPLFLLVVNNKKGRSFVSPLELFLIWLLVINLLTVVIYRYDKRVAGSGRSRIPESRLASSGSRSV